MTNLVLVRNKLISWNFCKKIMRENSSNFHTVEETSNGKSYLQKFCPRCYCIILLQADAILTDDFPQVLKMFYSKQRDTWAFSFFWYKSKNSVGKHYLQTWIKAWGYYHNFLSRYWYCISYLFFRLSRKCNQHCMSYYWARKA